MDVDHQPVVLGELDETGGADKADAYDGSNAATENDVVATVSLAEAAFDLRDSDEAGVACTRFADADDVGNDEIAAEMLPP